MSFAGSVSRCVKSVKVKTSAQAKKLTIDVLSAVVMGTPVLTGKLRGGWTPSIGSPNFSTSGQFDTSGQIVIASIVSMVQSLPENSDWTFYLSNTVPYGPFIEYDGISRQAPSGMVRVTMTRIAGFVSSALRG